MTFVLAIDQGTTSSRSIIYDAEIRPIHAAQKEFKQIFPHSGWVEHDPEEIWQTVLETIKEALAKASINASDLVAIGITNQRETTVVWDRKTGAPIYNAIVWQDRRTGEFTDELRAKGHEALITARTGLLADPYFSSTKVKWILDNVEGARARAAKGELAFGTIDSFLIWRLTGGASHVTDATNAARTMLYDIHQGKWSDEICQLLDIPMAMLPTVLDSAADFGTTDVGVLGSAVPIAGVAGDQQAATVGQAAFEPGMIKSTYGTGCFVLLNTGDRPVTSKNRMLTTIAYQLNGKPTYALEGSIFIAGAAVQWLRDSLKVIEHAGDTHEMAEAAVDDLILVPAFTGLGAPYWRSDVRGAMFGLTRGSGPNEFARAALRSVGYQTRDLIDAMNADYDGGDVKSLRIDGGMSASEYAMQFTSDILGLPLERPANLETTALGAAWLAGMHVGVYPDAAGFAATLAVDHRFEPSMRADERAALYANWKDAVSRLLG